MYCRKANVRQIYDSYRLFTYPSFNDEIDALRLWRRNTIKSTFLPAHPRWHIRRGELYVDACSRQLRIPDLGLPLPLQADVGHGWRSSRDLAYELLEDPAGCIRISIRRHNLLSFDVPDVVSFALGFFAVLVEPGDVGVVMPEVGFDLLSKPLFMSRLVRK